MKRVLVIGPEVHGANSLGLASGFRELGHVVELLDIDSLIMPPARASWASRAIFRAVRPAMIKTKEREIGWRAKLFAPDLVVVFKGNFFTPNLLAELKSLRAPIVNFYPDVSMTAHTRYIRACLPLYDAIFTTKSFGKRDFDAVFKQEATMFYLPHGFSPAVHRPMVVEGRDREDFGADASFIGTWSPSKEKSLAVLARAAPEVRLRIWGNHWGKSRAPELRKCIEHRPVTGDLYAMALCCTTVNLAILSERRTGASQGDEITSRTFHIPATGAFMLHKRTQGLHECFVDDHDVASFDGDEELVHKVRYFLQNHAERNRISTAGYETCLAHHRFAHRALEILDVLGLNDGAGKIARSGVRARLL